MGRQDQLRMAIEIHSGRLVSEVKRLLPTCVNCEHFKGDVCTIAVPNQTPPPKVIAFGCNEFCEEVPF